MDKQLYLIKEGGFDWLAVDTMPLYELNYYYNKLVEWMNPKDEFTAGL